MITVIGSINLDLIASIDRLPGPGETVLGERLQDRSRRQGRQPGARCGARRRPVRMVGAVGKRCIRGRGDWRCLKEGRVDLSGVREAASRPAPH